MTNRDLGRAYIEDARVILTEAEASVEQGPYHRVPFPVEEKEWR